jgi:hypothetical protein
MLRPSPRQPSTTRRRLLRRGGATLGGATLAGLAGCSAVDPGFVGDDDPELPEYATWLPAPDRVLLDPADAEDEQAATLRRFYPFAVRNWPDVGARLETLGVEAEGNFAADEDDFVTEYEDGHVHPVLPLGPRDAGLEVTSNRGLSVLETGMDDSAVVEAFERHERAPEPFERVGEYEGYELLAVPDSPWTVGVRDGVVVEGFQSAGFPMPVLREPRAVVEAVVDARNGEDRYVDADGAVDTLVSHLGTGTYVRGQTYPGPTATSGSGADETATPAPTPLVDGTARTLDGETFENRFVAVFESASAASVERLSAERSERPFEDWSDVETRVEGRAVVVTGTSESNVA